MLLWNRRAKDANDDDYYSIYVIYDELVMLHRYGTIDALAVCHFHVLKSNIRASIALSVLTKVE